MLWPWHSEAYGPVPYGTELNLLSVCPGTGRVQNTCDFSFGQKREMCQSWLCSLKTSTTTNTLNPKTHTFWLWRVCGFIYTLFVLYLLVFSPGIYFLEHSAVRLAVETENQSYPVRIFEIREFCSSLFSTHLYPQQEGGFGSVVVSTNESWHVAPMPEHGTVLIYLRGLRWFRDVLWPQCN